MATTNQIEGGWTELKGKIKETWGDISDDELKSFEGNMEQLVGMIQRQTGQAKRKITEQLQELDSQFRPMLRQAADTAQQYYEQTTQAAGATVARMGEELSARHADAEQMVRRHPMESVAVALGAGLVTGVVLGLMLRSR